MGTPSEQTDRMTNTTENIAFSRLIWQAVMNKRFLSFVDITVLMIGNISKCLLKEGMSANTIKQQP